MRALIFAVHAEDPSLGVRRIAARVTVALGVSVSRETVRLLLRAAEAEAAARAPAGVMGPVAVSGPAERSVALSAVLPMTEADHAAFDAYRGAMYESPGVWFWSPRPSPGDKWWVFP